MTASLSIAVHGIVSRVSMSFSVKLFGYIYNPHRNIFIQRDGIAMGSVLGHIFINFYLSALENMVFDIINKLNIYL